MMSPSQNLRRRVPVLILFVILLQTTAQSKKLFNYRLLNEEKNQLGKLSEIQGKQQNKNKQIQMKDQNLKIEELVQQNQGNLTKATGESEQQVNAEGNQEPEFDVKVLEKSKQQHAFAEINPNQPANDSQGSQLSTKTLMANIKKLVQKSRDYRQIKRQQATQFQKLEAQLQRMTFTISSLDQQLEQKNRKAEIHRKTTEREMGERKARHQIRIMVNTDRSSFLAWCLLATGLFFYLLHIVLQSIFARKIAQYPPKTLKKKPKYSSIEEQRVESGHQYSPEGTTLNQD